MASFRIRGLNQNNHQPLHTCSVKAWSQQAPWGGEVMADRHREGNKASFPVLRDLGREKVRQDLYPQSPGKHRFRAHRPEVLKEERGPIWGREIRKASFWVGLEGGGMTDKVQCAYLFSDLVQGRITSLRFYFICQVGIDVSFPLSVPWKSRSW